MVTPSRNDIATSSVSASFAFVATALVVTAAAGAFGALDFAYSLAEPRIGMALGGLIVWLVVGALLSLPLAGGVAALVWWWRPRWPAPAFAGAVVAFATQGVAILGLAPTTALVLVPIAWLLAVGLARRRALGHVTGVAAVALTTVAAAALLLAILTIAAPRSESAKRGVGTAAGTGLPNVALVVLDTTRADHIGAYGDTRQLTPNLDRIAAEGVVFEQAIGTADWTVPTHASLFTGLYPMSTGANCDHHRWLDTRFTTLAEMLQAEGYQSVGLVANRYIEDANLQQGLESYYFLRDNEATRLHLVAQALGLPTSWVDKGAGRAVEALRHWLATGRDPQRPFFLFVNLMEPHWRYLPPAAQRRALLPPSQSYLGTTRLSAGFYGINWLAGYAGNPATPAAVRAMYAAEVAYQDEQLGALLAALSAASPPSDTLLIVTADHGENLGEAGRWDHVFAVNDYLARVPLIIRYPRAFPAGTRLPGQCQTIDVVPTVFDVLGRPLPVRNLPGRTLVPARFVPRDTTFIESVPYYGHLERMATITGFRRDIGTFTHTLRAARSRDFKLVASSDGSEALYDLRRDPAEGANVIAAHPDVAAALRIALQEWRAAQPPYVPARDRDPEERGDAPLSPAQRERLRSLGY